MLYDTPQTPWAWVAGGIAAIVASLTAAVRYLFTMIIAGHDKEVALVINTHDKEIASRDTALEKVIQANAEAVREVTEAIRTDRQEMYTIYKETLAAQERIVSQLGRIEGMRRSRKDGSI